LSENIGISGGFKQRLISFLKEYILYDSYIRKCGKLLSILNGGGSEQKIQNLYDEIYQRKASGHNLMLMGSLGDSRFVYSFHKNSTYELSTAEQRGILYFLDYFPKRLSEYEEAIRGAINEYGSMSLRLERRAGDAHESIEMLCSELLKHLKKYLKYSKSGYSRGRMSTRLDPGQYFSLVSSEQESLVRFIFHESSKVSYHAYKLVLLSTEVGCVPPQISIPYLMTFYSIRRYPMPKDVAIVYQSQIISTLDVSCSNIVSELKKSNGHLHSDNLCFIGFVKYLRRETRRLDFITKIFKILEDNDPLKSYFIYKNLFYMNFVRSEFKYINSRMKDLINLNELSYSEHNDSVKQVLLLNLAFLFKELFKAKNRRSDKSAVEYKIEYEDLLFKDEYDEVDNGRIERIKKETLMLLYRK
jgi:hypothetical protein